MRITLQAASMNPGVGADRSGVTADPCTETPCNSSKDDIVGVTRSIAILSMFKA